MELITPEWPLFSPSQGTDKKKTSSLPPYLRHKKSPSLDRGSKCSSTNQPQVRFLWRFDRERFLRLCCEIFRRRFFLRLPMIK